MSPNKKKEKWEKGQCYYPFSTLVLQSSVIFFMIESLLFCHFHILVGIFHYRTWLVYSNDGLLQNAIGLHEQASWMHTHLVSFVELSYIYSSSASIAWQSLLLALTSIGGHLPSPLISLVDVRLSPFCLLHITPYQYSIPPIVQHPWLTLMYWVKVEKSLRLLKYETIAWLVIRVVHDLNILCDEDSA